MGSGASSSITQITTDSKQQYGTMTIPPVKQTTPTKPVESTYQPTYTPSMLLPKNKN
jgi:hypothetical protein